MQIGRRSILIQTNWNVASCECEVGKDLLIAVVRLQVLYPKPPYLPVDGSSKLLSLCILVRSLRETLPGSQRCLVSRAAS